MSTNDRVLALAAHLDCSVEEIEEGYDGEHFDFDGAEYWVLTDSEADQAWDESLEEYIDDCILDSLPDSVARYFDREAWKRDARHDGRGHSLSGYDGEEHEVKIGETRFYIYRTN